MKGIADMRGMETATEPYESWTIRDHSTDGLRSGEGAIVVLKGGTLFLAYSEFSGGGSDESSAVIAAMESNDRGTTWSPPRRLFTSPADALNAMSVSLLRLQDGRIGCVFAIKYTRQKLIPFWTESLDEGQSWSSPRAITDDDGYFIANNDRLIQHRDGTLIVPYGLHEGIDGEEQYAEWNPAWNAKCGLFYSKDGGTTWQRSAHTVTHTPEIFEEPMYRTPTLLDKPSMQYQFSNRLGIFQEPGVVELPDGSLMLHARSNYAIYRCFASGVESPWVDPRPIPALHVCTSPQVMRRIPGSDRLVMIYNDRGTIPFGTSEFSMRTPLSIAISDDAGRSWTHVRDLEGTDKNYCYPSLVFDGDACFLSYYESAETRLEDGRVRRRTLASLKFGRGRWRELVSATV